MRDEDPFHSDTVEIQRAWDQRATEPDKVAQRLPELVERSMPADSGKLARLVISVLGEQLGRFADGLTLMERLSELARVSTDGGSGDADALDRGLAMFRLCTGDTAGCEAILVALGARRSAQETVVLALAAVAAGLHGRPEDAARWLQRAQNLSFEQPDSDLAVQEVARSACALADRLLQSPAPLTDAETALLRSAAICSRVAGDRSGTWIDLERAERRLARAHLVLGEPLGAVAHAEACLSVCLGNAATADELAFAYEVLSRARRACKDPEGAAAARERLKEQLEWVSAPLRDPLRALLASLL